MKTWIQILIFSLSFNSFGQKWEVDSIGDGQFSTLQNKDAKVSLDTVFMFGIKGQVQMKGRIGPSGIWTFYNQNGKTICVGNYEEHTRAMCVIKCGQSPRATGTRKEGMWIFYYPDGKLKARGKFQPVYMYITTGTTKISLEVGYWEYFYPNGQIIAKGTYDNIPKDLEMNKRELKHYMKEIRSMSVYNSSTYQAQKTGKWLYFDQNGNKIGSKKKINEIGEKIDQIKLENKELTSCANRNDQ